MKLHKAFAVLLCATALAACDKNAVQDITGPLPAAQIKFFNFAVGAPKVNFYANDQKITAIRSTTGTEDVAGVVYGGVGAGDYYTGIQPGQYTLSGRISAATDKDLPISGLQVTIADGKKYSFYQSGRYNTAEKKTDAFIVEDNFPAAIDYTQAYVRFVHAIHNGQPMTLYAKNRESEVVYPIGGEVAYKAGGAFTPIPVGAYDLYTRAAGSDKDVIVRANVTFAVKRVHTIAARGDMTVTTTAANGLPFLDNTTNR
jgi:hypothetical protein